MPATKFSVLYTAVIICFISCRQADNVFTNVSPSSTNIHFTNKPEKRKAFGILYYLYYYNGGGVATGDINNDGLVDIYFTANSKGGNKLYVNKGNLQFEDITAKAGVAGIADWCSGVTMADVNGDGFLDIYVCAISNDYGLTGNNQLFINNGNSTFTESAAAYGLNFSGFSTQTVFFDYDHDGDLDCYILNQSHARNENIPDTSVRRRFDPNAGDRLFRNDMNTAVKKFTDVSAQAGIYQSSLGYGLGISVADMNNDGWEDIYVGNDFHENDYYYLNNGNGTFTESGSKHFNHFSRFSMGNDVADYNNDGQMDVVTVDMLPPDEKTLKTYGSDENIDIYKFKIIRNGYEYQFSRNCLQRNNGDGISFSDVGLISGISATDWSWSPLFADFDNDGKKDLFISSGIPKRPVDLDYIRFISNIYVHQLLNKTDKYDDTAMEKMPDGSSHPFFFKGDGKLAFKDVSNDWGSGEMKGCYNGAAYADLDNDGDLDMVMNVLDAPAVVMKNNTSKKNYLSVSFKGDSLNTFGIGAKAYLFTKEGMQYQQLMLTRGFQSSSETRLHFGLDSLKEIDSILIIWPNQKYQLIKKITANQQLTFNQKDAGSDFDYHIFFPGKKELFTDITAAVQCDWEHKENDFTDFNVQYLIPHEESTRGPKIAVADVNKDGLEDFYVCGAKFQPGALMIQQANGTFKASDTALFNRFTICEDVDAKFFDANGDGAPDLWVVSGGNEFPTNALASADRLFINDGKGNFSFSEDAFDQEYENKSCIAVADVDKDGDEDVFIGNLSDVNSYGLPKNSYLYLNNGKGKFELDNNKTVNLSKIGMVTSASFTDLNNDGWPDLVVSGEWMPMKIFINNKGNFTEKDVDASTGLWQTIYTTDVNGDGYADILAGNWGHNSKLWAGKTGPLKLYVKDFDRNGSTDQILTYNIDGQEYPFLAKDELERALPVLRKYYLKYNEVAGQTVQYIFYDLFKDYTELKAETLSSSCFINDGKGNFKRIDLPDDAQLAPVFSFESLTNNTYMAAGNFYGVLPYEGRYDALQPTMFSFNKNKDGFNTVEKLPGINGEARDTKWLNYKSEKVLVIARNNDGLIFLKPVNK